MAVKHKRKIFFIFFLQMSLLSFNQAGYLQWVQLEKPARVGGEGGREELWSTIEKVEHTQKVELSVC